MITTQYIKKKNMNNNFSSLWLQVSKDFIKFKLAAYCVFVFRVKYYTIILITIPVNNERFLTLRHFH
jgi:hypothetical protein